jgi:hypothetical protein
MRKVKDLCVKIGSYQKDGQEKGRWKTIGAIIDDGKGGEFMFLDRSFNPAGVPFKEGSESIVVSMFDPKGYENNAQPTQQQQQPVNLDDEIPF